MQREPDKLDTFHDVEFGLPERLVGRIDADSEDGCGDVQAQCIDNYHPQHISQGLLVADDQMESRVENERLSSDHRNPSGGDEWEGDFIARAYQEAEDESDGVQSTSPRADE